MNIKDLFLSKVTKNPVTGCWEIDTQITPRGYRVFKGTRAHRFSYEMFVGPIPEGKVLNHICRNRGCVNPEHLEIMTIGENLHAPGSIALAALNAAKTHCPKNHEYSEVNTRITSKGGRACRTCEAAKAMEVYSADPHGAEKQKLARANRVEDCRIRDRAWSAANRDKINEQKRARYAAAKGKK